MRKILVYVLVALVGFLVLDMLRRENVQQRGQIAELQWRLEIQAEDIDSLWAVTDNEEARFFHTYGFPLDEEILK